MSDELELAKAEIQTIWGNIEEVISSQGLLEGVNEFPTTTTYLVSGRPTYSLGRGCIAVYRFQTDLHLSRAVMPNDETETIPFVLLAYKAFARNITLSGLCEHCIITEFTIGGFQPAGERTYGIRFVFEVKIRHTGVTVAAGS